ncbi:YqcC family protein [Shewanella sp. SR43-4]|uniref:YqcC family protein n=1 Tax=Shewanella TaxID=22 RepID=UPI000F4DB430|nr:MULTISPECIES: YqcC family protein [Shewanella]MBB1318254.1 YqcC family protein [Shewanella sp. SR43-4]MBB1320070.1 YqcC family protein [Shewanella sp. SR43-8]MBB1477404.1 YqcC family protein [Shewanella sp. SG41-3]RPA50817.1 YqcC family protein [Shewanella vesiculosa]UJL44198.1 YqcC family protein [Shewanella vesiculosa]
MISYSDLALMLSFTFMLYLTSQNHLIKLEQLLKEFQLWSDILPPVSAMTSTAPFCCDVMAFEQWLQFIFIPKMTELVVQRHPLPSNMALAPMAEHVWQSKPHGEVMIAQLRQFDILLSQR